MLNTAPQIGQDFYDTLRARELQAREFGARHLAVVLDTDSMLYWLACAARGARLARQRKHVHIAASAGEGVDQSTISRFENHTAWPDKLEQILSGYADDLEIDEFELWAAAIDMWREYRALSPSERATWEAEQAAARRTRGRQRATGKANRARHPGSQDR